MMEHATPSEERHTLHKYLAVSFWLTIILFVLPEGIFGGSYLYSVLNPDFDFWGMIPVNNAFMLGYLLIFFKPLSLLWLQHLCAMTRDLPCRPSRWRIVKRFFWFVMIFDVVTMCSLFYIANHWAE